MGLNSYEYDDSVLRAVANHAAGAGLSAAQREVLLVATTNVSTLSGWDAEAPEEAQRGYLSAVLGELEMISEMEGWDDTGHRLRRADTSRADAEAVLTAFRAAYPNVKEAA